MNGRIVKQTQPHVLQDLEKINRYTRRPFTEDEVYTFSVVLCDNEVDRDFERFSIQALRDLSTLFLGKSGIFDHNAKAQNQLARIYDTQIEQEEQRVTSCGEVYTRLVAKAYLPRCDKNMDLITEIESGMKKEVSVGCAVAEQICSICGANLKQTPCRHEKGKFYDKDGRQELCCTVLNRPTDAYEWSFVAVPAQREAGVIKRFEGQKQGMAWHRILKSMRCADKGLYLSRTQIDSLLNGMDRLLEDAECGRVYREQLCKNVVKFAAVAQPQIAPAVMKRVTGQMSLADLQAFEKAFLAKAGNVMPVAPQLAADSVQQNSADQYDQFKI